MILTIPHKSPSVEYTGRWEITDEFAASSACGSSFRVGFSGMSVLISFDISKCLPPYPHIYISVDGSGKTECAVDSFIRVWAEGEGDHELTVIMKSSLETQDRWNNPIARVVFTGCLEALPAALAPDTRPIIEFTGDSITEGSSVYPHLTPLEGDRWLENLVYTNDVCSSYSYQTARLLGWRPVFMGYGSTGVTKSGGGGVPRAAEAYEYLRRGVVYTGTADHVVMNSGANDRDAAPEDFIRCYREFADVVRGHNPGARLWIVAPFCGAFREELRKFTSDYTSETGAAVSFVDTEGWISPEPLHPNEKSHLNAARRLAEIISKSV